MLSVRTWEAPDSLHCAGLQKTVDEHCQIPAQTWQVRPPARDRHPGLPRPATRPAATGLTFSPPGSG